jgi:hypothetical protein
MAYCPRSSLPAHVLAWLAARLAHLAPPRPPGQGGTRPLRLEARLDAVGSVLLDGLSYRRAGRAVGISKTEVGDSLDLLLGPLAALGFCQPDGSFVTSLDQLGRWLAEMTASDEAVLLDGLATRVQRPRGWGNQKVLYDAKRHTHTARGWRWPPSGAICCGSTGAGPAPATSTSCSPWQASMRCWTTSRSQVSWTAASAAWPSRASTGTHGRRRRTIDRLTEAQRAYNRLQAGLRALVEQAIGHLANAWALRRWRGLLWRVRDVFRAAGALICLGRWLHRVPA